MNAQQTTHRLSTGREITISGDHLYRVVATTDDGQRAEMTVAANDEWKARTAIMSFTTMDLRGQRVEYDVTEVV